MAFCWMSMALESPWTANFLVAGLLTTFVPMAAAMTPPTKPQRPLLLM